VPGSLGGDGAAEQLARLADREVADVDHLLDLAAALREDLADLDRHQRAEVVLRGAQLLTEQPDELTAPRCRDRAPLAERVRGVGERGVDGDGARAHDPTDHAAVDGRRDLEIAGPARRVARGVDAEATQQLGGQHRGPAHRCTPMPLMT
jgi:hypothetical protein